MAKDIDVHCLTKEKEKHWDTKDIIFLLSQNHLLSNL